MARHGLAWFRPGRRITVRDRMQRGSYELTAKRGRDFDAGFQPALTPGRMLRLGVFEGKYLNDCEGEFPREWYAAARRYGKLCPGEPDPAANLFKVKSRLSLGEWQRRGWTPVTPDDMDVRGWFQWYCRYWLGRRQPEVDAIQIRRWRQFVRHSAQVAQSVRRMRPSARPRTRREIMEHRPRQRQALLQWAHDPFVI